MKGLETGKDKIQKICDVLKEETLKPARQEAREIVENAHLQASEVVVAAKKEAAERIAAAEKEIEEKRKVFQSSLHLACRQGIELLKQRIEKELFDKELADLVAKEMADPKIISQLLMGFIKSMEEKGIEEDFAAVIPKSVSPKTINAMLSEHILQRLKGHSVSIGDFDGGVQIRLTGRQITIDISDKVVRELIAQYIRRDFRELVFNV
ncbi:MAG: V-type ATP synthase subunit E [Verrucomicrobia bacterium]|nr:V-type ATP synthase subunit E [Verrucomicrobiota bacterium]